MPGKKKPNTISEESFTRLAAEYANFQRRTEEEKNQIAQFVKASVMEELFPVLDNFHRAASHAPELPVDGNLAELTDEDFIRIRNYFRGLKLIEKQLEEVLASLGLKQIPTTGQLFNPNLHEAISYEASADVAEDHIIDEVETGYVLNERVIRPAKVRVSKG